MAIKINAGNTNKADVTQRAEQGSSKAKVEVSNPAGGTTNPHWKKAEGEPASKEEVIEFIVNTIEKRKAEPVDGPYFTPEELGDALGIPEFPKLLQKRKEHLEYQARYQRDLRKAKPLGMKVKEWREKNGKD